MSMKNYFKAVVLFAGLILAPVLAFAQSPCTITQLPYACRLDTVPECWSGDNPQHIYGTSTSPEIDSSIPISQLR